MEHFFHSNLTMYLTSTKTTIGGNKKFYTDILFVDKDSNHITIDNLSGGEYDRCALALFLTFNKLSKTPILLLDEALSSLHSESVNDIVDTIKECIQPKTVLITLHQCNTGIFDQVINVENLLLKK
jgi:ABC-type Mn2+/Zn2+ transport system ATPase subunit